MRAQVAGRVPVSGRVPIAQWTPATDGLTTFWLDLAVGATITGGRYSQALDRAGSSGKLVQYSSAALPASGGPTCNGAPTAVLTSAGETLYSSTGPAWGSDIGGSFYAVGAMSSANYPSLIGAGSPGPVAFGDLVFVGARAGQYAACAYSNVSPFGSVAGSVTSSEFHLIEGHWNLVAQAFGLRVDGVLLATTGATFNTSSSFPQGFGIVPQSNPSFEGSGALAAALWRMQGLDVSATRQRICAYLFAQYNTGGSDATQGLVALPRLVAGQGTSLVQYAYNDAGTADATNAAVALLPALFAAASPPYTVTSYNDGHAGMTSTTLLTLATSPTQASPFRSPGGITGNLGFLMNGANDLLRGMSTTTALKNLATNYNGMLASGYQIVVVCTEIPWITLTQSAMDAYNNGVRYSVGTPIIDNNGVPTSFPHVCDVAAISALTSGMSVSGGAWSGTYDDINRCNSGSARGHLTAAGQGVVANALLAVFMPLMR